MAVKFDHLEQRIAGEEVFTGCVLPVQYNPIRRNDCAWESERRLLVAVLEDAIRCFVVNRNGRTKAQIDQFEEVQAWFNDRHSPRHPRGLFAFETVCEALGIDPGLLRQRLTSISPATMRGRCQRHLGPILSLVDRNHRAHGRDAEAGQ